VRVTKVECVLGVALLTSLQMAVLLAPGTSVHPLTVTSRSSSSVVTEARASLWVCSVSVVQLSRWCSPWPRGHMLERLACELVVICDVFKLQSTCRACRGLLPDWETPSLLP
jgi:hypothetical protein